MFNVWYYMGNMASVGRPRKFESPEQLQELVDKYFKDCDKREVEHFSKKFGLVKVKDPEPYTMSGLAYALGVDRETLLNYEKRDEFLGTIKRARDMVHRDVERRLMEANSTGAIFNLKNNFGWKDKTEQDITTGGEQIQSGAIGAEAMAKFTEFLNQSSKG